jgi:hypothetical protein
MLSPMNSSGSDAGAGGIEVDDAAAHGELPGLVGRILRAVAGVGEPVAEIDRRDLVVGRRTNPVSLKRAAS